MSRLEQLPNGHWIERYDHIPDRCTGCGQPLASPNITLGTAQCDEHGSQRSFTCRACRTVHVDCPCDEVAPQALGTGYFAAPAASTGRPRTSGTGNR